MERAIQELVRKQQLRRDIILSLSIGVISFTIGVLATLDYVQLSQIGGM